MIDVDKLKRFVYAVANKNGKGTLSPEKFNLFAAQSVYEYNARKYGNDHEYQPGRPIPRQAYQLTQDTIDSLRHLKESRVFYVDSDGKVSTPDGTSVMDVNGQIAPEYLHYSNLRSIYSKIVSGSIKTIERPIKVLKDDEVGTALDSSIVAPTKKYPACEMLSDSIQFYPKSGLQRVRLTYLRQPNEPVWAYTLSSGRPVYDSANSVNVDAPKDAFNEISANILSLMGINLRENQLVQYAQLEKQES